jgi:hypothetical protein
VKSTVTVITMHPIGTVSRLGRTCVVQSVIRVPALITTALPAIAATPGTTGMQTLSAPRADWHALTAALAAAAPASQIHATSTPMTAPPSPAPAIRPTRAHDHAVASTCRKHMS